MEGKWMCIIDGDEDMYGIGIRTGFYAQWYGSLLADWIAPSEAPNLALTNVIFSAATLVALIARRDDLYPPEMYIVFLLFFGSTLYTLPVALWRVATCFKDCLDPSRWQLSKPRGKTVNFLWSLLVVAETSMMLWFWGVRVPRLDGEPCEHYGFMFAKIRINSTGFRIFHMVIGSLLLVAVLGLLIWDLVDNPKNEEAAPSPHRNVLCSLNSILRLCVAVTITVAVEVTIKWNSIHGLNLVGSAGQLIPILIGTGAVVRVLYVFLVGEGKDLLEDGIVYGDVKKRILHPFDRPMTGLAVTRAPETGEEQSSGRSSSTESA